MKKTKKHKWITEEDGSIDMFAAQNLGSEYHNGPKCSVCGFEFCHHCFPEGYKTKCGEESLGSDDSKLDAGFVSMSESMKNIFK